MSDEESDKHQFFFFFLFSLFCKFFWEHCKFFILPDYFLFIYGDTLKRCFNVKQYNLSLFKCERG